MTNADDAGDQALLINALAQAEYLLHSLEQAAGSIGLCMNANKTEFMYLKQEGAISTLIGKPLKLVDLFTYHGSNISTENNVNVHIGKALNCYRQVVDHI